MNYFIITTTNHIYIGAVYIISGLYLGDENVINPGKANSNRNIIDNTKPIDPPINPDIIYTAPI